MEDSILIRWAKIDNEIAVHEETLYLKINGRDVEFRLLHNFNMLNLDIYAAIEEWSRNTNQPDIDDFCKFVLSQAPEGIELICYPKESWDEFQLGQNFKIPK